MQYHLGTLYLSSLPSIWLPPANGLCRETNNEVRRSCCVKHFTLWKYLLLITLCWRSRLSHSLYLCLPLVYLINKNKSIAILREEATSVLAGFHCRSWLFLSVTEETGETRQKASEQGENQHETQPACDTGPESNHWRINYKWKFSLITFLTEWTPSQPAQDDKLRQIMERDRKKKTFYCNYI